MEVREPMMEINSVVSGDIIGPLPRSSSGCQYIFTFEDVCSKYLIAIPTRSATAQVAARVLVEEVLLKYGKIHTLLTDNGSQFVSNLFKKVCRDYGIQQHCTAKFCPQTNSVERYNKNIKTCLSIYVHDNQRVWDKQLKFVLFALNSAVSEVTNFSPHKLFFGRELRTFETYFDPINISATGQFDPAKFHDEQQKEIATNFEKARKAILKAKETQAHTYNTRRRVVEFAQGDLVWLQNHAKSVAVDFVTRKLLERYKGPYQIKEKLSKDQYEVQTLDKKTLGRWHVEALKPVRYPAHLK